MTRNRVVLAMVVVLLVASVAAFSCAGEKGPQGPKGDKGDQGPAGADGADGLSAYQIWLDEGNSGTEAEFLDCLQGPPGADAVPGPNMIVAMGSVGSQGWVAQGYNIDSSENVWNEQAQAYFITLAGIDYHWGGFITIVTPNSHWVTACGVTDVNGQLYVSLLDANGQPIQGFFSFIVLQVTDDMAILTLIDLAIAALNELDFQTPYNQKTPGYRSRVTLEEYQTYLEAAHADILPLIGTMKISVIYPHIRVEGEWAYLTGKLALNGTVLLEYTDEFPDIWHKIDGTWYDVEENPMDPGYDPSELPQ